MQTNTRILILGCLPLFLLCGCGTTSTPITNSLNDLVVENRTFGDTWKDKIFWGYFADTQLNQHEVLSIAGTLPIPDAGLLYYYPDGQNDPAAALGIRRTADESSMLVGTCEGPTNEDSVLRIKAALEDVQERRLRAVSLTAEKAAVDAQLATLESTNNKTGLLQGQLTNITTELDDADKALYISLTNYHKIANVPGIIIAEWAVSQKSGSQAKAGQVAQAESQKDSKRAGFIILAVC